MSRSAPQTACVIGTQWGDEGKGKIVDVLCEGCDAVARFQGGANAGHTVKFGGETHVLHLLPSGILRPGKQAILGNGMVIDPETLLAELDAIHQAGIHTEGRLFISDRAHVVMPYHRALDKGREERAGADKIGTTLRGIGPCYEDKAARRGIRVAELIDPAALKAWLSRVLPEKNALLAHCYGAPAFDLETLWREQAALGAKLKPAVVNAGELLAGLYRRGARILFEGAQGALLDIDLGTYPYVTSSNTCPSAIGTGCGFPVRRIDETIGVVKAYTTRVGAGPFPSEAPPALADLLRERGGEYGATTGRPRRCGWLDMAALARAVWTAGVDSLVITKVDVLDTLPEIKVAVGYRRGADRVDHLPASFPEEPPAIEWKTFPGWRRPTGDCRRFEDLPAPCRDYIAWIGAATGCAIRMVSVGPDRAQTIVLDRPLRATPP
ncbi:MAG TPA: adenylosuccinate synthase [Planctomycetota bacterium]|jgi:adenylosuccinate synthase|nr:adenylosuccinate synthase [Planctomycetota bacterium]OQC20626.1 MAG: Adenylosuccinate synthetase [Planctomycetes bacterium ADurb.Bin069]NMD35464.1 adenylosuccinate synthase [Planctomycetota bacterium]HNR98750.1 adenylosuccinate synthase [Planctomycetota bacterium]HNU25458.1 adenylosuccinate synthase [Planctomycetota bacterium]